MKDQSTGTGLPPLVRNIDFYFCGFCRRVPEHLSLSWIGPHIAGYCPRCASRLPRNDIWLSRDKYGLHDCKPDNYTDASQGELF